MREQEQSGGRNEADRVYNEALAVAIDGLGEQGYRCYPLKPWLRAARQLRMDRLHDWAAAQLPQEEGMRMPGGPGEVALRDTLDGYRALEIDPLPWLPDHVQRWYAG